MPEFYKDLLRLVIKYNLNLEYDWDLGWNIIAEDMTFISIPVVVPLELGITRTDGPNTIKNSIVSYLESNCYEKE